MNSKATMTISSLAIAAVALLFASGPIVGNQQAQAYVYYHGQYYHHGLYYRHPYYYHHYYHHGHYYRHY